MIRVLETAIDKIRVLSEERQRFAAGILEQIAAPDGVYALIDDERRLVLDGLAQLDRGEGATQSQVRAIFDKYRA